MYFTAKAKVGYAECDIGNRLKLSAALKRMEEVSSQHLEALQIPPDKLLREGMVFLLNRMCLKIHRMPVCGEELVVGTAPVETRGARFVREFVMDSAGGERLVSALSLWMLVNPANRRVLRPASFPYPLDFQKPEVYKVVEDKAMPKVDTTALAHPVVDIPVRYSHLDVNGHVNNTVYADFVCDMLPMGRLREGMPDTVIIHYQREARWGDVLTVTGAEVGEGEYLISGQKGGEACFQSFVQFT